MFLGDRESYIASVSRRGLFADKEGGGGLVVKRRWIPGFISASLPLDGFVLGGHESRQLLHTSYPENSQPVRFLPAGSFQFYLQQFVSRSTVFPIGKSNPEILFQALERIE